MRPVASVGGLILMCTLFVAGAGCNRVTLHKSFGQRYRDVNMAQLSAHPAHEPITRGIEAQGAIEKFDRRFSSDSGGAAPGGLSTAGSKTAGVSPLH